MMIVTLKRISGFLVRCSLLISCERVGFFVKRSGSKPWPGHCARLFTLCAEYKKIVRET